MNRTLRSALAVIGLLGAVSPAAATEHQSLSTQAWIDDGVPLAVAPRQQVLSSIIPDGAGGAIVVWQDDRLGSNTFTANDVFAQRITAEGLIAPGWLENGVPVCTAVNSQYSPATITDGAEGAIVMWQDCRVGIRLFAQRIAAHGQPLWATDGVRITAVDALQGGASMIPDGAGGAIVVWLDNRQGRQYPQVPGHSIRYYQDVYAQRIGPDGIRMWGDQDVAVTTDLADHGSPRVVPDGAGGALVTWNDRTVNTWLQRLDASGNRLLGPDGVDVDGRGLGPMVEDGAGGLVSVFASTAAGLALQRVTATGQTLWPIEGVDLATPLLTTETNPALVADGTGGAIVTWPDLRNRHDWDLYAQRVDGSGAIAPGWPDSGFAVSTRAGFQVNPAIAPDGAGGAFIAWIDYRDDPTFPDTYALRVTASGTIAPGWPADGLLVTAAPGEQVTPMPVADGAGGTIVAWTDYRVYADIYAQRIGPDGVIGGSLPTPVGLSLVRAEARGEGIHLEWFSSGPLAEAPALERDAGAGWSRLASVASRGDGYMVYDDLDVTPGHRYGYRLTLPVDASTAYYGEAWVELSPRGGFALEAPRPNPAHGELFASIELPDARPAVLEMLDVTGRRVVRMEVGPLGAGSHPVRIAVDRPLPAGVYLLKLSREGVSRTRRVCVIE